MAQLLIVDDETNLLRNLSSYLSTFDFEVSTATTAEEALIRLEQDPGIDLLLTDVRLPGMDGIELLRRAAAHRPTLRFLVMTAYPSREVHRSATTAGALRYLQKPLDLRQLRDVLTTAVNSPPGWSGSVGGLDIFDFTQLFAMSGKTTCVRVRFGEQEGLLAFRDGRLVHASSGDLIGDKAFFFMTTWQGGTFEQVSTETAQGLSENIRSTTSQLMVEAARLRDEASNPGGRADEPLDEVLEGVWPREQLQVTSAHGGSRREDTMAIKDHLVEFERIEGFEGVAVFTAQGEMLEGIARGKLDIKTVGTFANNALLNAQKATDQMGVGRGNLMQIRAPQAIVLMRCLNEATDFAATKEGKAHFHTVVVMSPDGNTGMASMILDKMVLKVADEVR